MKDRLEEVKEHYMEQYKENSLVVNFELTFEEFLLFRLEGAEAANDALLELTGMNFFVAHPGSNPEELEEWLESQHDPEEENEKWRNDNV